MRDISLYLQDILDAMLAIEQFVEGISFDEFKTDDKTSSAVIRKFEIIGEAAKHIPEEIRNKYPLIPWKGKIPGHIPIFKPVSKKPFFFPKIISPALLYL